MTMALTTIPTRNDTSPQPQEVTLLFTDVVGSTALTLQLGDAAAPAGTADLSRAIFANEPRVDILHDVVRWQRAKMRRGTAFVKNRAEVSGTGKKPFNQKGTGRARSGSHGVAPATRSPCSAVSSCCLVATPAPRCVCTAAASSHESNSRGGAAPSRMQKCPTATRPASSSAAAGSSPSPSASAGSNTICDSGAAKCAAPS